MFMLSNLLQNSLWEVKYTHEYDNIIFLTSIQNKKCRLRLTYILFAPDLQIYRKATVSNINNIHERLFQYVRSLVYAMDGIIQASMVI